MQLFSKRNVGRAIGNSATFLNPALRIRLMGEIKYIITTDEFLERCLLVENKEQSRWYLDEGSMSDLSLRELGYNITSYFDFDGFRWIRDPRVLDDFILFDLIELLLIFSKEDKRAKVRERFQKHFSEEGDKYVIHDFLIALKDASGIKPYIAFFKEKLLRDKFSQYYSVDGENIKDYNLLAKISADILQFIFSGTKKGETKSYSEKLMFKLAEKSVEKPDVSRFSDILNKTVLHAKLLNNEISNIRHSDKSTLLVDNPSLFKLIASQNINLAEFVIFADPELYFFRQKAIDFKNAYITEYKIGVTGWVVQNSSMDNDLRIEDIPF